MRISGTTSTREHAAPGSAIDGLVDELLAYYVDWRHDAAAVRRAYRHWAAASRAEEAWRFAAYTAALDQEEASAERYALILREVERALEHEGSRSASPSCSGTNGTDATPRKSTYLPRGA